MAGLTLKALILSFIPFLNFVRNVCFGFPKMGRLRIFAFLTFNHFRRSMWGLSRYSMVWASA